MCNHIVFNENLFGYPTRSLEPEKRFFQMVVMAVDVSKGGDPTLIDRTVLADKTKVRTPNETDYERFGILH